MSTSFNVKRVKEKLSQDRYFLNTQRRQSFLALDNSSSGEGHNNKEEDHESTCSECPSVGLATRPMSITESSENPSYHTGSNMPSNSNTYIYQVPPGNVQPVGTQLYQPLIYGQQSQLRQGNQFTVGFGPLQVQPMTMHSLHQEHIVYPMQRYQHGSQDWTRMPAPTTAVPSMMRPISNPQLNNLESQQLASSAVSSTVSTPLISCFSSPGYVNAYGYMNTPVLSSASCTPIPCSKTRLDVPPLLDLIKFNAQKYTVPQRISCSINMGPVPTSGYQSAWGTTESVSKDVNNSKENITKILTNSLSSNDCAEAIQNSPAQDEENIWQGSLTYEEWKKGGSNLFITWAGRKAELVDKLHSFNLKVRDVINTSDENILNVIFETHPIARKAFTMQSEIHVRIVPPKNSHRIWWRNPSPKFLVQFETKCRLVVRKGKAECHEIVGELLSGCLITADQLKGNRIRVLCCEGSFMFPGGKVVEMKGVPNKSHEKASLGWVSYRCKRTKEILVIRRSWNKLGDYILK